jgi:hypothetical protein
VYAHLISTPAIVSGYDIITSLYLRAVEETTLTLITLLSPCWFAISLLIFWRRSGDWMALSISFAVLSAPPNQIVCGIQRRLPDTWGSRNEPSEPISPQFRGKFYNQ